MVSGNEIRRVFLDYFASHGHEIVASSPLVPRNDPTLMFTNAGMVQFKNVFTGQETRPYKRAVTSQKCVRAGGKHNDLENVGYTVRHHTFFEMMGNFSFGDYFKDLAIELAWNLVTKEFGLPAERLLVTVYAEDDEAARLWRKISGLPEKRIIPIATSDNFWQMGDTGPCGPCSEIFYDHGPGIPGGPPGSPEQDGDRFIEIWNLVFMQFEQRTPGQRVPLPKPSIDTGLGLERMTAVLQGTHDNYAIDLLRDLIEASVEISNQAPDGPHSIAHRVIADHLRATAFLIADGVLPSNEGRGYVLRRIMRRAMRHVHKLGVTEPMIWRLVPNLVTMMGQAFPELVRAEALIAETLKLEERGFGRTLDRGIHLLEAECAKLGAGQALSGAVAFKLYDTFGFPLDLTRDILRGQGRGVDQAGFDAAMGRQRARARKAWTGSGEAATDTLWFELRERFGATEFLGYDTETAEGEILALVSDDRLVEQAEAGQMIQILSNQTPFYGESGGQVGDSGRFLGLGKPGCEVEITDTQKKLGDLHVHGGRLVKGRLAPGDAVEMRVDGARRTALRLHHSATHLLHEALRRRLGAHVTQKGSLVAPDRLRFDFSHPKPMTSADIEAVEAEVNARIRINAPVATHFMTPEEAVEAGALALFGEKYGDEVRVVSMGGADPGNGGDTSSTLRSFATAEDGSDSQYSTELCGGTHVRRGGDIGLLKIVGESALAAGVRRIEALAGAAALDHARRQEGLLGTAAAALKAAPADLPVRISGLLDDRKRLERELTELRRKLAVGTGDSAGLGATAGAGAREIGGVKFAARLLENIPAKDLKPLADQLKAQLGTGVVALVAVNDGKASLVVGVTGDLTDRLSAVDLVRAGAAALGGKGGGGRPDMAQAGGPQGTAAPAALTAIETHLAKLATA